MAKEHDEINHVIRNATTVIKSILRPYHKTKVLDDQHWVLILLQLKKIENTCGTKDLP